MATQSTSSTGSDVSQKCALPLTRRVNTIQLTTNTSAFYMRCDAFDYVIWNAINQFDVDVILRYAGSFTHITIPHATFIIMLQNIKVDNPITYPEITTSIPLDGAIIGTRNIVSILLDKCFFHVKFSGGNEYKKMFDSAFTAMTIYTGLIEILNMRY